MKNKTQRTRRSLGRRLLGNDVTTLLLRLLSVALVMAILKAAFYMIDKPLLGHINGISEGLSIVKGSLRFDLMSILWTNSLFILLSILPFRFREHRWYQNLLFVIFLTTNSALIILNSVDVVYFEHTMKRLTLEDTHFSSNTNNFPIIVDFITRNLPLIIISIVLIAFLIYAWHYINYHPTEVNNNRRYYHSNTIAAVVIAFLCFSGMRGTLNPARPWTRMEEASSYSLEKTWLTLSNPYCFLRSLDRSTEYDPACYFSADDINDIYSPERLADSSRHLSIGQRNVMVFILESFSKEHSKYLNPELYPHETGCTPFLDSLMQEGYTFVNAYANGLKSIESVPAIFASIPSFKTSFATMPELFGDFDAMPELLVRQGYETAFFSGSERNSMGFEDLSRLFGVQKCYCRDEFEAAYPVNDSTIEPFWGVYDMPYFQFMADEIDKMHEPFFASVFNLTSHHPYRVPPDYVDIVPQGHTAEQRVVAYTDLSLRKFFERVKSAPWFNNTLFVFVADHVAPMCYDPQSYTMQGHTSIIEFMYTPDSTLRGLDSSVVQQLDIMPTVLGLVGNKEPYLAFGRDVFNEPERRPVAFNCINQVYQCITDSSTFYFDTKQVVKSYGEPKSEDVDLLKAVLQRYAACLTDKDYTVDGQ